jgi:hypothetical protein
MSPEINTSDIPDGDLKAISDHLVTYFVPLLVLSPEDPKHPVDFAGSGTLVELNSRHYILTADHVWNKTQNWPEIGLVLEAKGGTPLTIPRAGVSVKRLGEGEYSEWGPDLALIELPRQIVGAIQSRKSFLNLARRREMLATHPPTTEKALWVVVGMVGESSTMTVAPEAGLADLYVQAKAFFGGTCRVDEREGFDYITTNAETTLPEVPTTFGGVSGGGLWQVDLARSKRGVFLAKQDHFRGVAFWEQPMLQNKVAIRCHGPRSLFEVAWRTWELDAS